MAASPRGTYLTIADALRKLLTSTEPPETLPSEAQLMAEYDVARTTARRAFETLAAEGLVVAIQGVGWRPTQGGIDRRPLLVRVVEKIRADGLQPGDGFPSEAELCKAFGVSRTAIRGPLAQLEGRGVLESVPGKGRRVIALP